jgi:hypothetical protein
MREGDGAPEYLFPSTARLRNLTYRAPLFVDVTRSKLTVDEDGSEEVCFRYIRRNHCESRFVRLLMARRTQKRCSLVVFLSCFAVSTAIYHLILNRATNLSMILENARKIRSIGALPFSIAIYKYHLGGLFRCQWK